MTSNGTPHHNAIPSEVGWQFVPQYYNFVNKEPERLHCFYNKRSTFIHGSEGEDGKTCHGQQEIHAQITSLGFQDCNIFIHSVDAQSSADGGIIIQVIGEMSNHSGPWRKFVQTFFLAEQPNGYFVLNDIFRFLKEDSVEGDLADEPEVAAVSSGPVPAAEPAVAPPEFIREPSPPPTPPVEVVEATAPPVEEPPVTVAEIEEPVAVPTPEPVDLVNGHEIERPVTPAPASKSPAPPPADIAPTPPPVAPVAAAPSPSPAPAPAAAAPVPAHVPAAAPVPKTWANLAALNTKKWGNAVAHDSRGSSENIANSSPSVASTSGTQTPVKPAGAPRTPNPTYAAAQSVTTAQCFIKSVTEPISPQALTAALTRFGPLKAPVEIVRNKACAFAEFATVDAAKRAIVVSLPPVAGGEGGIKVDVGGGESLKIIVETKKERGERPVSRGRGGGPPFTGEGRGTGSGSDTRGGFRGTPRGTGRGRGAR